MPEVRLIDANALKAKLKIGTNTATYSDYCNGYCDARHVDLDAIDAAPTIEAEPVRHGRWILCKDQYNVDNDNGNYAYYCSCCKHQDVHAESAKVSFCWNCGADMREGGEQE